MTSVLIALLVAQPAAADTAFIASEPQSVATDVIDSSRHAYTINLGGTADMDNTLLQGYSNLDVAFQPNISLSLANIGDTPIIDPWVVINRRGDWRDIDHILAEALHGARDDREKILFLYEFARTHRYHALPLFLHSELHDPVRHFNTYGAGLCDDMGSVTCALAFAAGLNEQSQGLDPINRSMHGHVMSELPLDGRLQFIDTDENAFYLGPDNERIISGDEIMRDSYWAIREHCYGPLFSKWGRGETGSALLGSDDTPHRSITLGHEMHLTLRPGEKLTYRWDNVGKTPGDVEINHFANSALDLTAQPTDEWLAACTSSRKAVSADGRAIIGHGEGAEFVVTIESPYVIAGAEVSATFDTSSAGVDASLDGRAWQLAWDSEAAGSQTCSAELDALLGVKTDKPVYRYHVRIRLGTARLTSLHIHTTLLTAPLAMPRLSLGKNIIRYTDATDGPHRLRITHAYRETANITPPPPPELEYPPADATIRDATADFRWSAVENALRYRIRVSRRPDLKIPYRPAFDVIIDTNSHASPFTGMFSPDHSYYWSVRACNEAGLWGDWAPTQVFRWDGPMPPVDLALDERDDGLWLTWNRSARGPLLVRYEVHASNRRGFRPSKEPYQVHTLGEVPATFVAATDHSEMRVVSPTGDAPNSSAYRVVAIDMFGTPSGPSWALEIPCPRIYSQPILQAEAGRPHTCTVKTLRCDGDLQYRYQKPGYAYWEREGYEFSLAEGPPWLSIDAATGVLSGTPPQPGQFPVRVVAKRTWPDEVKADQYRPEYFAKDAPEFQAEDEQTFTLTVVERAP